MALRGAHGPETSWATTGLQVCDGRVAAQTKWEARASGAADYGTFIQNQLTGGQITGGNQVSVKKKSACSNGKTLSNGI